MIGNSQYHLGEHYFTDCDSILFYKRIRKKPFLPIFQLKNCFTPRFLARKPERAVAFQTFHSGQLRFKAAVGCKKKTKKDLAACVFHVYVQIFRTLTGKGTFELGTKFIEVNSLYFTIFDIELLGNFVRLKIGFTTLLVVIK